MSKVIQWVKDLRNHFIDDCKSWYKLWSSWLAIVWGLVVTIFWNDPTILGQMVGALPSEYRAFLSPLVMLFVGGLPIMVRMLKQRKLDESAKQKEAARAAGQQ